MYKSLSVINDNLLTVYSWIADSDFCFCMIVLFLSHAVLFPLWENPKPGCKIALWSWKHHILRITTLCNRLKGMKTTDEREILMNKSPIVGIDFIQCEPRPFFLCSQCTLRRMWLGRTGVARHFWSQHKAVESDPLCYITDKTEN